MKQKFVRGIISILALLMVVSVAVNAQVQPTSQSATIGGENQERSNPLDDDGPRVITSTRTVTFNTASLPAGQWRVVIQQLVPESRYSVEPNLRLSQTDQVAAALRNNPRLLLIEVDSSDDVLTIPAGGQATDVITLKGLIPANLDAIDANFDQQAFKVAAVTFQVVNISLSSCNVPLPPQTCERRPAGIADVLMQAENILEINDIDVEINSRERQSIDDGDSVDNRKPSDKLDFDVEVENTVPEDSNLDVRDADLEIDCDSNDIDIDDENVDLGDVNADDTETESLNADIEEDAEDGNINCNIRVGGLDRNGARHGERIDFDIEIERKNHDIQIKTLSVNPSTLTCTDSTVQLSVTVLNLGTSDEDEVALDVTSKPLNIQQRLYSNRELDEDDSDTDVASIALDPKKLKPGTYAMQVQSFYDNVKLSDTEIVQIENTCDMLGTATPDQPDQPDVTVSSLSLDQNEFNAGRSTAVSVPVRVSNTESVSAEYVLMLDNVNEFGEQPSTKTVFLNPGQTTTVFLNLKVKSEVPEGKYSATVKLLKGDEVVDASEFVVNVSGGEQPKANSGFKLNLGGEGTSRVFWVIGDIVLVVIAIFFIRLIFTAGGKKRQKKMADFEPETRRR